MDPNGAPEPTLPPQEQIRQKRLAKLGALASANNTKTEDATKSDPSASSTSTSSPAANAPNSTSPNQENKKPSSLPSHQANPTSSSPSPTQTQTQTQTETQTQTPPSNPFSQLGVKNKTESGDSTTGDSGKISTSKRSAATIDSGITTATPSKKMLTSREESLESWSHHVLSDVFRVTLEETQTHDHRGNRLIYLPELKAELEQSGDPIKLTASSIDAAILEAARHVPANRPLLDYLLPCWKRVVKANKPARPLTPERQAVLSEAKRLCMSNCIFALTMPEYFGRDPNPGHDSLVPYLLVHHDNEDGICLDFFAEAVSRIPEDDSIAPIFTDAMVRMSGRLASMTMNDDYKPFINCLVTYARFPPLLNALTEHPRFQVHPSPSMSKEQIAVASETQTILGPFFRISPLQTEVTRTYFAGARTIDPGRVKSSQSALQMTLKAHQSDLANIAHALVRASQNSRNSTLDWFAFIMNSNHKRRALQVKPTEVASDGFMVNVTAILDKLCEPFLDTTYSKIDKIDVDYLRRNPRVDMSDETKLNADQATADAFFKKHVPGPSNFISEVFFLALAAHHYGLGATNAKLKDLDKDIKYVEGLIRKIEDELPRLQNDPLRLMQARTHHQQAISSVEKYIALKLAIEGVVLDESMQTLSLLFMRYVSVWLLRVASGTDYKPGKEFKLPLPADQPEAFSCLPEYALQDVVDNFKFVFLFLPRILLSAVGEEVITLCITFLRSSEYIKNPYLKSSLVTLLYSGTWPIYHLNKGVLGDFLVGTPFANEHLLHALMKFYIECEHSGVSSAFYDKFNIRYEIFQVIKCIWPNSVYQDRLSRESKVNRQFFVQFVNLLLNDATYLLDEALTKLVKIHDYQKQLQDDTLSPEDKDKIKSDLEAAEQQCQSWMQLVNDTMGMMKLFTAALRDAFTMPEIVTRLAGMLNYNLESLVGPKRSNLKVADSKKYHFEPRTLLSDFIDIYINLAPKTAFIEAVAADGRSYKPANFDAATKILEKISQHPETISAWKALIVKFAEAKERQNQAELDLGEIPAEFEDPLMGDLMTDPVILPSHNIVDRSTIVQQLLSNPRDPFTRMPMTIDDVVPANDLRIRIEEWKAERIAQAKAKASGGDAMDTTDG